jgi:hypothetical protein
MRAGGLPDGCGHRLIRVLGRFSRDRPRFTDTLDVIKFLCKDLWMLVFRKQIDNLKTNHRVCSSTTLRREMERLIQTGWNRAYTS